MQSKTFPMIVGRCLLTLSLVFLILTTAANSTAQSIFGPDDYSIYSALISKWYRDSNEKLVVIRDHTALHTSLEDLEVELSYVRNATPALKHETANDFKAKNIKSYLLERFIDQKVNYKIISQKEIARIFGGRGGWQKFYAKYLDAEGILTFSRVGFNFDKTQALVYVANQWNHSAGAGIYILLGKQKDNTWFIQKELRIWNSWCLEEAG